MVVSGQAAAALNVDESGTDASNGSIIQLDAGVATRRCCLLVGQERDIT